MSMNSKKSILLSALFALVQPVSSMEVEESSVDESIHPLLRDAIHQNNVEPIKEIKPVEKAPKKLEITVRGFDNLPAGRRSSHIIVKNETKTTIKEKKKNKHKNEINTKNLELTIKGYEDLPTGRRSSSKVAAKGAHTLVETENKLKRKSKIIDKNVNKEKPKNNKKTKIEETRVLKNNNSLSFKEPETDYQSRIRGVLVSSPADWRFGVHAPLQGLEEGVEQQFSISVDSSEG